MTEFEEGDTFRSPDDGRYWQVTDLQTEYVVTIRPEGDEYDEKAVEQVTYPADVLTRKLEWGDIEPVDFQDGGDSTAETTEAETADKPADGSDETEADGGMFGCTICEKSFETAHGLATHKGVQH